MKLVKDKNILRNCKLWQVWLIPSGYGFPMTPDPDYLKRRPLVTLTSLDVSKGNRLYSSLIASLNGASFEPEPRQYKIDTRYGVRLDDRNGATFEVFMDVTATVCIYEGKVGKTNGSLGKWFSLIEDRLS